MSADFNATARRIGQILTERRKQAGLTVRELAEKADVNYSTVSLIENGGYNASVRLLNKIANVLDLEISLKKL